VGREAPVGPAASPPAQRGERFASGLRVRGRYRVVSEIGAGAFGTVCAGEDESTGHRVAIRFLPRNFANTPQASQAVLRMGRSIMAASTSHPAMARVLEFGELDAGRPFTVTEFVEGRRLSEMLAGHTPLEVHAADYAVEPRYSLRQVYFDPRRHGANLERDLAGARRALAKGAIDAGDPTLLPPGMQDAGESEVAGTFGVAFAAAAANLITSFNPLPNKTIDTLQENLTWQTEPQA